MPQHPETWTPERVEWLREAWLTDGLSATEIGKKLGISRNAALGKLNRIGLLGQRRTIVQSVAKPRPAKTTPPLRPKETAKPIKIEEPKPDPETLVSVLNVGKGQCRWPIGDPSSPDFMYCGKGCEFGHPYCPDHEAFLRGSRHTRAPRKKTRARLALWMIK